MHRLSIKPTRPFYLRSALVLMGLAGLLQACSETRNPAGPVTKPEPVIKQSVISVAAPSGAVAISLTDRGAGRPYLFLHGGAGPGSMAGLAAAMAGSARVVLPTHPGFQGQPRPEAFKTIPELASAYLALLDSMNLNGVILVGNSMGGWVASEMATRHSPRVAGLILLNALGVESGPHGKVADLSKSTPAEITAMAFYDPAKYAVAPATPEALAMVIENQKTLRVYGGAFFTYDPTLRARLAEVAIPTLVAWGSSDKIADVAYGLEYAESIPGSEFVRLPYAGHFPQIERTATVAGLIPSFLAGL